MTQEETIAAAVAAAIAATSVTNPTQPIPEVRETNAEALSTSAKSGM